MTTDQHHKGIKVPGTSRVHQDAIIGSDYHDDSETQTRAYERTDYTSSGSPTNSNLDSDIVI